MKTKKVLILILLVIIAISATACVDKNSVEYIYNIRRFVGEYENEDPGIWISAFSRDKEGNIVDFGYDAYVNQEITASGINGILGNGEIGFIEKEISIEEVEYFNHFIKLLGQNMVVKRTKIIFPSSNANFKIAKKTLPSKEDSSNNIYQKRMNVEVRFGMESNSLIAFEYTNIDKEPYAELGIVKKSIDQNEIERILTIAMHYKIK